MKNRLATLQRHPRSTLSPVRESPTENVYVLEGPKEFERLERQAQTDEYHFHEEFLALTRAIQVQFSNHGATRPLRILDAGTGSGFAARALGHQFKDSEVLGWDQSEDRVSKTQSQTPAELKNRVLFQTRNLLEASAPLEEQKFDVIFSRFVFQHMPRAKQEKLLGNLRCHLKDQGLICLVDIDGILGNLHPLPAQLSRTLAILQNRLPMDFHAGRGLHTHLLSLNPSQMRTLVYPMIFHGESLRAESERARCRLESSLSHLEEALGSNSKARDFIYDYINALQSPHAFLYYSKIVSIAKFEPKIQQSKE